MAFSLLYAAPEVIAAAERGETRTVACPAADMWALGVIAFELLTSSRAFPPSAGGVQRIRDQLCGRAPLPWEASESGVLLSQLRVLKRSVLQCLSRDPTERPSSRELLGAWNGLFEGTTGKTTANYPMPEPKSAAE